MGNPALTVDPDQVRRAPTISQAARRLLDSLDRLVEGCEAPGFAGWENGNGVMVGDEVEEARHELRELLNQAPAIPVMSDAFESVWKSEAVQAAFRDYGWRGGAEVLWRTALATQGARDD